MKRVFFIVAALSIAFNTKAQKRLQPMSLIIEQSWEKYYKGWWRKDATQQMIKFPSLMAALPSALYVYCNNESDTKLVVRQVVPNEHAGPNEKKTKVDSTEIRTDGATALAFGDLIEHAVMTSMYIGERIGFDGTRYFFESSFNIATTWSPVGNSKKLTDVLERAMAAVRSRSEDELKGLLPEVKSLTEEFKKLYPLSVETE